MDRKKSIGALNKLIQINNELIKGYETALGETGEYYLKNLFSGFVQTSKKCVAELQNEIKKLGGIPTNNVKKSDTLFRLWMDLKIALRSQNPKTILDSCEFGEDTAVKTYKEVITNCLDQLSFDQRTIIKGQFHLIKAGHDKVRGLGESLRQTA